MGRVFDQAERAAAGGHALRLLPHAVVEIRDRQPLVPRLFRSAAADAKRELAFREPVDEQMAVAESNVHRRIQFANPFRPDLRMIIEKLKRRARSEEHTSELQSRL